MMMMIMMMTMITMMIMMITTAATETAGGDVPVGGCTSMADSDQFSQLACSAPAHVIASPIR
jgi:hypothetical protein